MRILMSIDRNAFSEQAVGLVAARSKLMESAPEVELGSVATRVAARTMASLLLGSEQQGVP